MTRSSKAREPRSKLAASGPLRTKPKKTIPFEFVLEALAPLEPEVRPMFGGHIVYIGAKAVLMLRDSPTTPLDNGLWLIFAEDFDESSSPAALRHDFPSLRPITVLNGVIKHWLLLPSDAPDFESSALHACELLLARDSRLGRVPKSRR